MNKYFITVIFDTKINGHKDATFTSAALNDLNARSNVYKELRSNGIELSNVRTIKVESMTDFLKVVA